MTRVVCWVIGAGPAGMYATQAILRAFDDVQVILTDMRRVPFGLGRFGIAPDHPKMRRVITPLERIVDDERVHFVGGVEVPALQLCELAPRFDAVVVSTGAGRDHPTAFEDALPSRDFFGWYNADWGVPVDDVERVILDDRDLVVLGGGNVSIDIVRLLCVGEDRLRSTDIPERVVDVLLRRPRRPVHLVIRSAASALKFSTAMMTELVSELGISVRVHHAASYWAGEALAEEDEKRASLAGAITSEVDDADLHIYLGSALERDAESGFRVKSVAEDAGLAHIPFGNVITAIGYGPGQLMTALSERDAMQENVYVCGWAGNNAKGVLGTNKADAIRIVGAMKEHLATTDDLERFDLEEGLAAVRALADEPVGIADWRVLAEAEVSEASRVGRGVERVRRIPGYEKEE